MERLEPTADTTLHRRPQRGSYERATIDAILDEGLVCHVGFVIEGRPFVIPTIHARIGDKLYLHGSAASRMQRALAGGIPVCVTVTLVDGLVLARSAFHHSMNYRSVVVLGRAASVTDPEERLAALWAIVEHVVPGRRADVRAPTPAELAATQVLCLPIEEASAKVRTGPPVDSEDDHAIPCWAGEIPLRLTALPPVADPRLAAGIELPDYVTGIAAPR